MFGVLVGVPANQPVEQNDAAGELHEVVYGVSFFFQAEDGIRDVAVTGVQTCALPISTTMGAEELMPFSLPRVAFTGVSLDNPAPGAVPFIRVPLICVGAFVPGVCVAVDTGVVTPPAQEETEIFLGWCIPGSHPLYHAVPSNAARMLLRIASRSIPARNPGVNSPRARKDRLDGGSDLRKTRVGLGAGFRSGGGTQVGSISASCGKACEPRLIA